MLAKSSDDECIQLDVGTMLPNEMVLDVLSCVDYKTLVFAKLTQERFRVLVTKFATQLAHGRRFIVLICDSYLLCSELPTGAQRSERISYEEGNPQSLAAACRTLADEVIGPHAVFQLTFYDDTWNTPDLDVVFKAAPLLKYAERVELHSPEGATISGDSAAFMSNIVGMKKLRLIFHYDAVQQEQDDDEEDEDDLEFFPHGDRLVEELVRNCITLPRLRGGDSLEVDLLENFSSGAFGRRIIEVLKGSGCALTFRMKTKRHGELVLDGGDYTGGARGTTKRYASEESGIVVEVRGHRVTIQSTAAVPRKKPRMN
ncbi:hypothetical protein AAVH_07265 [Aphelenchoides avenae]|nr:hypothetical protein AAVH_07265 [Aphelenchus avenae]